MLGPPVAEDYLVLGGMQNIVKYLAAGVAVKLNVRVG
jgi:hypothetical protein